MRVSELIEKLELMPQDWTVVCEDNIWGMYLPRRIGISGNCVVITNVFPKETSAPKLSLIKGGRV